MANIEILGKSSSAITVRDEETGNQYVIVSGTRVGRPLGINETQEEIAEEAARIYASVLKEFGQ